MINAWNPVRDGMLVAGDVNPRVYILKHKIAALPVVNWKKQLYAAKYHIIYLNPNVDRPQPKKENDFRTRINDIRFLKYVMI